VIQELRLTEQEWKNVKFRVNWNPLEPPKFTSEQLINLISVQGKSGVWIVKPSELRRLLKKRGVEIEVEELTEEEERLLTRSIIKTKGL